MGALVTGVLVQYLPVPLHSAYLLLLAMTLLQGILTLRLPETIARRVDALGSLRPTIRVPAQARSALILSSPTNVAV